jgi:hypothetical protein
VFSGVNGSTPCEPVLVEPGSVNDAPVVVAWDVAWDVVWDEREGSGE